MLREYSIPKPATVRGYPAHRIVMGLTQGQPAVFSDRGDKLLVRTEATIDAPAQDVTAYTEGDVLVFTLQACCSKKVKGKHIYFRKNDWRARHKWLEAKATQKGFEVMTVHSRSDMATINDGNGREFTVDKTMFTGILKVTDPAKFHDALKHGVGSNSKTFGFGFLNIN